MRFPETDGAARGRGYNPARGKQVIAFARALPRRCGAARRAASWRDATALRHQDRTRWSSRLADGGSVEPRRSARSSSATRASGRAERGPAAAQRPAHRDPDRPRRIRSASDDPRRHRRRACSRRRSPRSWTSRTSIAAVDAEDKVAVYRNWLGLMKGDLDGELRQGRQDGRRARSTPTAPTPRRTAATLTLPGRSLLLVRNVGHLMTDAGGPRPRRQRRSPKASSTPWSRRLIALHDLERRRPLRATAAPARSTSSSRRCTARRRWPSPTSCSTASRTLLGLPRNTLKIGHHGRGAAHHASTSRTASAPRSDRIVFINTGFLDRTGDEIHTSMEAGPMIRKGDMKRRAWIKAYEDWNVDIGLACGLPGQAQIGKGMWAMPDRMADDAGAEDRRTRRPAPTPPGCRRRPPRRCTRCTTTRSTCGAAGGAARRDRAPRSTTS